MNKTMQSEAFKTAKHLSKLIPLGKVTQEKKEAVHRWHAAMQKALAEGRN